MVSFRKAFTLIELMIYLSLLVLLTTILLRTGLQTKLFSDFLGKNTDLILREHLMVDVLERDLQSASCKLADWDLENNIFIKKWLDVSGTERMVAVSFPVKNNRILRCSGKYDFVRNRWLKKVSSVLCPRVKLIEWRVVREGKRVCGERVTGEQVRGVWVTIKRERLHKPLNFFVRLRNGPV